MMPRVEKLRRENRQRGDSLYRTISYHHNHGQGMDLYKVGATLGCGTPALMDAGQLYYPYCFSSYEILDNGPLRTTVHLVYHPTTIGSDTAVVEHRYIQLDKGSNFNRVTVRYDGLTHPVTLATGVVVHTEGTEAPILTPDAVLYADPTENPRLHNSQLFVATLFPEGVGKTDLQQGHALGLVNNYQGQPYTYLSGSAWSRYDVRTMDEWQLRAQWALRQQVAPLKVVFK